jgi:[acyl-carrier-protein] S-malonyltransferase
MSSNKLVFVFPGQGAQAVGMGRDLYYGSPAAKAAFEVVDAACGFPVSALCFDGPEEALKETRNTQPALFATSVAALAACREAGIVPSAVAGHSVGEYAALVAAGALSVEEGARLVSLRGAAMDKAAKTTVGTMAAVLGLEPEAIAEACAEVNHVGVVAVANLNAPGQTVISGEVNAVEAVTPLLKARGAKRVVPLTVSGAFHSPLMSHAADDLRPVLASAPVADPSLPIVANFTADYERTSDEVRHNLVAQVAGSVRWTESVLRLVADGYTTFIECGSGNVLAGLIKRIAPDAVTYSVGDMASLAAAKEAVGA